MASRRSKKHLFNSTASGCMQDPVVYSVKRDKESPRGRGVGGVHTRCNCLKGIMTHSHSIERQPQQQHQQKNIIFHSTKLHTLREYTTYQGMLCPQQSLHCRKEKKSIIIILAHLELSTLTKQVRNRFAPVPCGHRLWLDSGQIGSFTVGLFVFTAWRATDVALALYFNGLAYSLGAEEVSRRHFRGAGVDPALRHRGKREYPTQTRWMDSISFYMRVPRVPFGRC